MTDKALMQQALEALDSDSPDIQLRAAIALRKALNRERNQTWSQTHWTDYEHGIVAAEREACAQIAQDWDAYYPETNHGACIAKIIRARVAL